MNNLPLSSHTYFMKNQFLKCGICGWCMEILWTGFLAFRKREMKLEGQSSIWMFPIYGMAAFIPAISKRLNEKNMFLRGLVYTFVIFLAEFFTGSILKKHNMCPWNYEKSRLNYKGVIRLDYAPLWFGAGLFFEQMLSR